MSSDFIYLNIAGFNIKVVFEKTDELTYLEKKIKRKIRNKYKSFISDKKPITVEYYIYFASKIKINRLYKIKEKKMFLNIYDFKRDNKIITYYFINMFTFELILKVALRKLAADNFGLIIHASANNFNRKAYLFLTKSGGGKSTISKFFNDDHIKLSDDLSIIRKERGVFNYYQNPFYEKNPSSEKKSNKYPVGKIFFIKKAKFFKIEKIDDKNLIIYLFSKQILAEEEFQKKQIRYAVDFIKHHNYFYFLYFGKNKKKTINLLKVNDLI